MKNSKVCPKCESREIYTKTKVSDNTGWRSFFISGLSSVYVDMYICTNCGYFEEYVTEKDMKNKKKMDKLKQKWKRL